MSFCGCSITDLTDRFRNKDKLKSELHENPRFWNDASEVSGSDNLFILSNEFFSGKPYNNILTFGDYILLVGEGTYDNGVESIIDSVSSNSADEEDKMSQKSNFEFSFDVYDPWRNTISASLSHDDFNCDSYQVVGEHLFLFHEKEQSIDSYDTDLNLEATYDYSKLNSMDVSTLYSAQYEPDLLYGLSSKNNSILNITPDSLDYLETDINLYEPKIENISSSGDYLLLSGIDKKTLKYTIRAINSVDKSNVSSIQGKGIRNGDISDEGFIAQLDTGYNAWVYQTFDGESTYFTMDNLIEANILPDNRILVYQEDFEDESPNRPSNYYVFDKDGNCLSQFSFSKQTSENTKNTYLSTDYAYLEDCDCIMRLIYTEDCMPYMLVWDLSKGKSKTKLNCYNSIDSLITKYNDNHAKENKDVGLEITLIPDTSEYDWGPLKKINKRATKLEDKYNISIYFANEVPTRIDYYDIRQQTNTTQLEYSIETLEKMLSCYPKDFFDQLCYGDQRGIRIYLSSTISGGDGGTLEDPSGFVCNINDNLVMVLDTCYYWDWDYTFHHEISHMIDRRLDFMSKYRKETLFSEKKWNSYNPKDFKYLESYENYLYNPSYKEYPNYFINAYGTTYATEDRAQLFGSVMEDYLNNANIDSIFNSGTNYNKKMNYYIECIRDGFDTSKWSKELPWECIDK